MNSNDKLSPRQAALRDGHTYYQSDAPCLRGHIGLRRVSNKGCVQCAKEHVEAGKWAESPEKARARRAAYRANNAEKIREAKRAYAAANRESENERRRLSRIADVNGTRAKAKLMRGIAAFDKEAERQLTADTQRKARMERERVRVVLLREFETQVERAERLMRKRDQSRERYHANPLETRILWTVKNGIKRAKKYGVTSDVTVTQVIELGNLQGWRCAYCGASDELHLDHKVTMRLGGGHVVGNLQWLCADHNNDKGGMCDQEYRLLNNIPIATKWDSL